MTETIDARIAVTETLVNMLENNIIYGYGNESFEGWCEDGDVFETSYPSGDEEFQQECRRLMREIAPLVDKLTYNYLATF